MRTFARSTGIEMTFPAGAFVFKEGDPADVMYVVHSGSNEMLINNKVVDVCNAGEALGFMACSTVSRAPVRRASKTQ